MTVIRAPHAFLLVLLIAGLLVAGCRGSSPHPQTVDLNFGEVMEEAKSRVSVESGANVSLPDGVALTIPGGAVDSAVDLRLVKSKAPNTLQGGTLLSDVYYLASPDRPLVSGPVTLSIPYDTTQLPAGAAESALRAYAVEEGGRYLYAVPSQVDTDRRVVRIQNPFVAVSAVPVHAREGALKAASLPLPGRPYEEAAHKTVGYVLTLDDWSDEELAPLVSRMDSTCVQGTPGEVHREEGHVFIIHIRVQTTCDFVRFVSSTMQEAFDTYNRTYARNNGRQPLGHLTPEKRMAVYLGSFNVNGEYKFLSWDGYVQVDVAAGSSNLDTLYGTLFHEMFHAVQDSYSNMFIGGNIAMWWYEATAEWAGLQARGLSLADMVNVEVALYNDILSIPIQSSRSHHGGLASYGYALLVQFVEDRAPGSTRETLNSWNTRSGALYRTLVDAGDLGRTYPDFVRQVVLARLPNAGDFWTQARIFEANDETRVFTRPSNAIGDIDLDTQILTAPEDRSRTHTYSVSIPPLTTRFFLVQTTNLAEPRTAHLSIHGDTGGGIGAWAVTTPHSGDSPLFTTTQFEAIASIPGLGVDVQNLWVAVYNADTERQRGITVSIFLEREEERTADLPALGGHPDLVAEIHHDVETGPDTRVLLGHIVNTGTRSLRDVTVEYLLGDDPTVYRGSTGRRGILGPGESVPFNLTLYDWSGNWRADVSVAARAVEAPTPARRDALPVRSVTINRDHAIQFNTQSFHATFKGTVEVVNASGAPFSGRLDVHTILYDAEDRVIGFEYGGTSPGTPIAPGGVITGYLEQPNAFGPSRSAVVVGTPAKMVLYVESENGGLGGVFTMESLPSLEVLSVTEAVRETTPPAGQTRDRQVVEGTVRNASAVPLQGVAIVAMSFTTSGASGKLGFIEGVVPPGETLPFQIIMGEVGDPLPEYHIVYRATAVYTTP